ncbi:uncharacterized protein LODBEIA_P33770 [Lodderomyces beijingensis]|uniref:GST N-terminal domain-containing protein n=1 Tax=Lodderomyces beijingensis TaxID=1775926 RepID=A0ABP0ZN98_9ASCO
MSQEETVVLHWLNQSRAQRIVWLFEELGLKYEIVYYERDKNSKAPHALSEVHPLGKSPVVEIRSASGDVIKLAESGWIIQYFLRKYDQTDNLKGSSIDAQNEVSYFLHYTEGTLQSILDGLFTNHAAKTKAGYAARMYMAPCVKWIAQNYYKPKLLKNLNFLNGTITKQYEKYSKYIAGNSLSAADIILSFPLEIVFTRCDPMINKSLKTEYPDLYLYHQNIRQEHGWKQAAKKVRGFEDIIFGEEIV